MLFEKGVADGSVTLIPVTKEQRRQIGVKLGTAGLEGLSEEEKAERLINAPEFDVAVAEVLGMDIEKLRNMNYELQDMD